MSGKLVFLSVVSLWMFRCFKGGFALQCYECTESDQASCGENFYPSNITAIDCDASIYTIDPRIGQYEQSFTCLYVKETNVSTTKSTFTRRCAVKNLNDSCEDITAKNEANKIQTHCIQCEKDLCNSSRQFDSSFFVIFLFILFFIFRI